MTKIRQTGWINGLLDKWISGLPMDMSEDPASDESVNLPDLEAGDPMILPPSDPAMPPSNSPRPRQGG